MDPRTAAILQKLCDDIAWRGPNGRPQGIIAMPRDDAAHLLAWISKQIEESPDGQPH